MGILWPDVGFLVAAKRLGVSFDSTVMIGRQNLFCTPDELRKGFAEGGSHIADADVGPMLASGYAEEFFTSLGATVTDSLDASSFEGSSRVVDLNDPLPEDLHGRYSAVVDAGTLEHVFNVPEALRGLMAAVKPGGHLVLLTPANGFLGHGFYQFSPELFFRVLTPENGFRVTLMLSRPVHRWAKWSKVADPAAVSARVEAQNAWSTLLYAVAERISDVPPLTAWPQQSDYSTAWEAGAIAPVVPLGQRVAAALPGPARRALRVGMTFAGTKSGPGHWQRVELADL